MNEIIKIDSDNKVSGRELHDWLEDTKTFQELFDVVYELMVCTDRNINKEIMSALDAPTFEKYGKSLVYLQDMISMNRMLPCNFGNERNYKEKNLQKIIVDNFNTIFPHYELIGYEVVLKNVGRIDILGREKATDRDVVIEIKVDGHNPNQQLYAYGTHYRNPILIGIVDDSFSNRIKSITYVNHSEIMGAVKCLN